MKRCKDSAGKYRISLHIANQKGDYHVQLIGHQNVMNYIPDPNKPDNMIVDPLDPIREEAPWVGTEKPFEGELCVHEAGWLEQSVPGKDYPQAYEFTVEKLD